MKPDYKIRPWQLADQENLVMAANNINIAKYMTDAFPHPYSVENAISFINMANKDEPVHIFAIEIDGKAVGGIGIHPQQDIHRKNAELGYWLAESYWGKGVIGAAVLEMIPFAFKTYPINRLFAKSFGTNIRSQKVLEKCGFVLEARIEKCLFKNGEYLDELIYAIRR